MFRADLKPLLDLIGQAEAQGRPDIFYGFERGPKPADRMTLDEVRAHQKAMVARGSPSSAAGLYQILRSTLDGLRRSMGLDGDTVFTRDLQDRMAVELLRGRGLGNYLSGETSLADFAHEVSKEWASFPNFTGYGRGDRTLPPECSYYEGDGLNRAHVSCAEVKAALLKIKEPIMTERSTITGPVPRLKGWRTLLFNMASVVALAGLTALEGFDWTEYVAEGWAAMLVCAVNIALRFMTTTPVGGGEGTSASQPLYSSERVAPAKPERVGPAPSPTTKPAIPEDTRELIAALIGDRK